MATEQQTEFYNQLRQETEAKIKALYGLNDLIVQKKREIDAIKANKKFVEKQIDANNKMLESQGQKPVSINDE